MACSTTTSLITPTGTHLQLLLNAHERKDDHRQTEHNAESCQDPAEPVGCFLTEIELHSCIVRADDHFVIRFVIFGLRHTFSFPANPDTQKGAHVVMTWTPNVSQYCDFYNPVTLLLSAFRAVQ